MGRSKGVIISIKVPIKWEAMTKRSQKRLRQIVGRDTRVIRSFLGIIEQNENKLLTGRHKNKIDESLLDKLTITAVHVKMGFPTRLQVPHDLKSKFPRISTNEISECRKTAVSVYESYLELRRKKGRRVSRPCVINGTRRMPRWVFSQRFSLIKHDTTIAKWWLNLRDSMDSVPSGKRIHNRLLIPLKISPFHLNQLERGEIKALQIYTDQERKWWVSLAVRIDVPEINDEHLPPAVLGIDLGIEKAACTTLVTLTRVRETRYFLQKDKQELIRKYDGLVADLQHELGTRKNSGANSDRVATKLCKYRNKRKRVSHEYDQLLTRQIINYILELSTKYKLYVALGRLTNIRMKALRGHGQGKRYRGMIHRWSFARISDSLRHQLSQYGILVNGKNSRFRIVPENWTSIICWKCGSKGRRPKQNYFLCPSCGHRTNADRNGAINIAARLITLTESLHNVGGLGKWADAVHRAGKRSRLKARKKFSSEEKSLLPMTSHVSDSGESAAVHHAQSSLLDFSDEVRMGDNDPAVERDAEALTVAGDDTHRIRQEKEARTVGGIPSR